MRHGIRINIKSVDARTTKKESPSQDRRTPIDTDLREFNRFVPEWFKEE
jgi:hypothetical protein